MGDPDQSFTEAAERKLLEANPELAALLDQFSPIDRAQFVNRWFSKFQMHRLTLADEFERAGLEDLARWLRERPLGL